MCEKERERERERERKAKSSRARMRESKKEREPKSERERNRGSEREREITSPANFQDNDSCLIKDEIPFYFSIRSVCLCESMPVQNQQKHVGKK